MAARRAGAEPSPVQPPLTGRTGSNKKLTGANNGQRRRANARPPPPTAGAGRRARGPFPQSGQSPVRLLPAGAPLHARPRPQMARQARRGGGRARDDGDHRAGARPHQALNSATPTPPNHSPARPPSVAPSLPPAPAARDASAPIPRRL